MGFISPLQPLDVDLVRLLPSLLPTVYATGVKFPSPVEDSLR